MKLIDTTFVLTTQLIESKCAKLDVANARWGIPEERAKILTPRSVPLASQALDVLEVLRDLIESKARLFPGDQNIALPMSNNTVLAASAHRGFKVKMTGYGFRGLASTIPHSKATRIGLSSNLYRRECWSSAAGERDSATFHF